VSIADAVGLFVLAHGSESDSNVSPRLNLVNDVEKITRRSRQTIDAGDREHVTLVERGDRPSEIWPIGPHPAHFFTKDLDSPRRR
jgi:hypothetical protein